MQERPTNPPTANMLAMLRRVAETDLVPFRTSNATQLAALQALERHGLVQSIPWSDRFLMPRWLITDAGRAMLREHE
jgi:hypothetical protein